MTQKQLITIISNMTGLSRAETKSFVSAFRKTITESLKNGETIRLRDFGRFSTKQKEERTFYNHLIKTMSTIPPRCLVTFKPYKNLLEKGHNEHFKKGLILLPFNYAIKKQNKNSTQIRQKRNYSHISRLYDGNIILPNKLNLGARVPVVSKPEHNAISYVGYTNYGYDYMTTVITPTTYPYAIIPLKGTAIIKYNYSGAITTGVTEPLLYHQLLKLKDIDTELNILTNISIPIKNRDYSYKPDIAVIWEKYGLYIDIEIDEPYDMVSRKPIHFLNSSDNLRNKYLIDNGWMIIRIAEEQIMNNLEHLLSYIKYTIFINTLNHSFYVNDFKLSNIKRWSYQEALKMEQDNYREQLLGIKQTSKAIIDNDFTIDDEGCSSQLDYIWQKPSDDILTLDAKYLELQNAIKNTVNGYQYFIIKTAEYGYEYLGYYRDLAFQWYNHEYCACFEDIIEKIQVHVPLNRIESFWGANSIYSNFTAYDGKDVIYYCMENSYPMYIEYRNSSGVQSERNVFYITPWYNEKPPYTHSEGRFDVKMYKCSRWKYIDLAEDFRGDYFMGCCSNKKTIRTFLWDRILNYKVFCCYKPYPFLDDSSKLEIALKKGKPELAEAIFSHLSDYAKTNIINQGNYCNLLVIQDKIDEAVSLCTRTDGNSITELGLKWRDLVFADIENFISKDVFKEQFQLYKEKLLELVF